MEAITNIKRITGTMCVRRKMLTYHKDNVILNPGNVDLDFPGKRLLK